MEGRGRREGLCMESVSQIERAGARSKAQWGRNQVMGETAGNWNDWAHGHRPDSANVNSSHTKLKTHSVCVRGSREGRMKRLPRHRWQVGPSPHSRKKVPRVKLEVLFLSAAAAATRLFEPRVLTRPRSRLLATLWRRRFCPVCLTRVAVVDDVGLSCR